MFETTNRDPALLDGGSVEHRLARLLDSPVFARIVPHLPPETLHGLIRSRGLDACSELVLSATPAQLTSVLDLDLWRQPRPGRDPHFDADRFGEWLELLVEIDDSAAARTVAVLDESVVVAGLSQHVRVFDPGVFEPTAQSDDEQTDRHEAMHEGDSTDAAPVHDPVECELGGYVIRARRTDRWDAIVSLLVALEAEHGDCFHRLMRGCRRLSGSIPEIDGLQDLLLSPEQHLHDVTMERERRLSLQGYATPADARAFLQMARLPKPGPSSASGAGAIGVNSIVAAYFRAADEAPERSSEPARPLDDLRSLRSPASPSMSSSSPSSPRGNDRHAHATDVPESLEAIVEILAEAGVMPPRPRALVEAGDAVPRPARLACLRRLMAYASEAQPAAYLERNRELAFLANTLLAGCSIRSRPFTPQEAADAAAGVCNLGLEYWTSRWPGMASIDAALPPVREMASGLDHVSGGRAAAPGMALPPDAFLIDHNLVSAFEVGWSVLHQDVSLFVAQHLISTLDNLHCVDGDVQRDLNVLRRTLAESCRAGTPWLARSAAEILAMLDMTAWVSVLGLLGECPIVPEALTAVLDGRTTSVGPTAFEFISTSGQIGDIRLFMRKLPGLLSR